MDRLSTLQQVIDRTTQAADRFGANRTFLEITGPDILTSRGKGYAGAALRRLLLDIAADHDRCQVEDCGTCTAVRKALAVALAELETMQRGELEKRVAEDRPRWWDRRDRTRRKYQYP
uniref:hypothetical protein n=1 Tax=Paractinoplanes polyasparticus TaxID=2856853 RepID=UPI001C84E19B|nr:hypothetical protein [Actinoplanes polyasparticus]